MKKVIIWVLTFLILIGCRKEIDSQKISLLDDVFKTFDKDFNYHLDIKTLGCEEELHQELVSIIENYALENNVYIESTRLKLLEKIIAINPKIKNIDKYQFFNQKSQKIKLSSP